MRRHSLAVWLLIVWTVFVWGGRVRNIGEDVGLSGFERIWRLGLALSFLTLTGWLVLRVIRSQQTRPALWALAGWTTVVWVARGLGIAAADHPAGFIAVHLVLAVVSIGLSAWAVRSMVDRAPRSVPAR